MGTLTCLGMENYFPIWCAKSREKITQSVSYLFYLIQ